MAITLLSKGAEILLVQFHEQKGDRVGARPDERVPQAVFEKAAAESPGVDFDGATQSLLDGNLIRREGEEFVCEIPWQILHHPIPELVRPAWSVAAMEKRAPRFSLAAWRGSAPSTRRPLPSPEDGRGAGVPAARSGGRARA